MSIKIGIDLSITRTNRAGTGVYASSLYEALRRIDAENQYVVFADEYPQPMGQQKTLRSRAGVIYHDLLWNHVILPLKARRAGVDILIMPANIAPVFSPCPTMVFIPDMLPITHPQHFTFWWGHYARQLMPVSARRSARVLTDSESAKQDIVRLCHVPPEKVVVTYLAASSAFHPVSEAEIAAVKAKYKLNERFILAVCTLEPRKNIKRLIQAYAQQAGLLPPVQLVHAGSKGWFYDDILAEAQRSGVADSVSFLGHVPLDDLVGLYNAAAVFVYPALYEGFGLPTLEAMRCGCPVITSNTSSLPEVVGEAGLLIDPLDVSQLAAAIQRVLGDAALAETMRRLGLARAGRFSWERTAQETLAACKQILDLP